MGGVIPAKSTLIFEVELLDIGGTKSFKKEAPKKEEPKKEEVKKEEPKKEETKAEGHDHEHPDSFECMYKLV